ncbi:unnamed protein product, partial [Owenia fusiformis]
DNDTTINNTLVIGSSIVRSIDPSKLINTDVDCISGGTIKDVHKKLTSLDKSYDRLVLQVGSNDTTKKDATAQSVINDYELLLKGAKHVCEDICVSSICPRTDKPLSQEMAETVNAQLDQLCQKDPNLIFSNNDVTFRLQNNSINTGFLDFKGLHLTKSGTNSLAQNMKLVPKPDHKSDITKMFNPRRNPNQSIPQRDATPSSKNENWQTVKSRNFRNQRPNPTTPTNNKPNVPSKPACFLCGETSHLASSCWHPNAVTCYSCNQLGHKSSRCNNGSSPAGDR